MSRLDQSPAIEEAFGRNLRGVTHDRFPDRGSLDDSIEKVSLTESLDTLIDSALRSRMPLQAGSYGECDRDALMNDFSDSMALLRQAGEDVKDLVGRHWPINVENQLKDEFVGKVADTFVKEYYGNLIDSALEKISSPTGAVSARLEARSVEEVETMLRGRLDRHLGIFAGEVKDLFEQLWQMELVGRVAWATDDACDSYYCEDRIVHESGEKTTHYGARENVDYTIGRSRIRQETLDVTKTRHTVYHGLHVKVIAGAKRHRTDEFQGIVPQDIGTFLRATPAWLCEVIRIVDGKTRFDDVVDAEIDLAEKTVGEPRVRYLVPPAYCPLVVVGEYVITGWGSKDEAIETARQNYGLFYVVAVALVVLSGIMSGLGRLEATWIGQGAVVAMLLSLVAFLGGRRDQALASSKALDLRELLTKGAFWFVLCLGVQFLGSGVAVMHGVVIGLGIILIWGGASGVLDARPSDIVRH